MERERDLSVDIAKGIGIILVLFGHTVAVWGGDHEILHRFIYSFHMPLFLGLSGIFLSSRSNLLVFIKSKFVRFIIPFFFWVIFYFLLSLTLQGMKGLVQSGGNASSGVPSINDLCIVPLMASWASLRKAGIYVDLWFLPAVFSIVVIYRLFVDSGLRRQLLLPIAVSLSFIIVFLNNMYGFHDKLPWSIDVAITCLPFIFLCDFRTYVNRLHWICIPVLAGIVYYFSREMQVEVAGLKIDDYPRFIVAATAGMALVFLLSAKLQSSWTGSQLAEVGRRAYLIFVLQGAIFMVFRPIMSRVPLLVSSETIFSYGLFFIAFAATYSMYPLFSRYSYIRMISLGMHERLRP
jgi:fucose 4-O-acetylase-like acetyltransferase